MEQLVQKLGRSVPEIVFRFAQQVGMIPLTGTTNADHMAQDLTCYEFELSSEEVDRIENIAIK
jgi:diketogulonate reductase-like aldo/keto reductase